MKLFEPEARRSHRSLRFARFRLFIFTNRLAQQSNSDNLAIGVVFELTDPKACRKHAPREVGFARAPRVERVHASWDSAVRKKSRPRPEHRRREIKNHRCPSAAGALHGSASLAAGHS
jgi:hypothetical protein